MASKTWLLAFTFLSLSTHFTFVTSQTFEAVACFSVNNSSDSSFVADLYTLLASLSSNIDDSGFHNASLGETYAIALCRADIQLTECRSCVNTTQQQILLRCRPYRSQAVMWRQRCMVRYADEPILGKMATARGIYISNRDLTDSWAALDRARETLFDELTAEAANGTALRKAAAGNRPAGNQTIYAMAQCTPDLSTQDCSACLATAAGNMSDCCGGMSGASVYSPSCTLRYDTQLFYNITRLREPLELSIPPSSSPSLVPPTAGTTQGNRTRNSITTSTSTTLVVPIVVPIVVLIAIVFGIAIFLKRKKQKAKTDPESMKPQTKGEPERMTQEPKVGERESTNQQVKGEPESTKQEAKGEHDSMKQNTKGGPESGEHRNEIRSFDSTSYDFGTIRAATNGFSDANKLGQGGFGAVYKGKLQSGEEIAVKKLSKDSCQGDLEFKNEALFLAKLQHRNLVSLLGFSNEGDERLLVYEFVENGSLDRFISDPIKSSNLNWETRYKIIGGVAKGLRYLHQDSRVQIIHRDLKASNVLLDEDMNPKISDFGLAKLVLRDVTQERTSRIIGTFGYMAPEYVNDGKFSFKSDAFSFGVLVLEIVTGQKTGLQNEGNPGNLLSRAWRSWNAKKGANMIDPSLTVNSGVQQDMLRCFHIALLCVQRDHKDRPEMDKVVEMLNGSPSTLPSPSEPGFYIPSSFYQVQELNISSENP